MIDAMLTELYRLAFDTKLEAELIIEGETNDNRRMIAIAKNALLSELISYRTNQIRDGREGEV
jgi:hypothetical protein